jgi:hypothetical protein
MRKKKKKQVVAREEATALRSGGNCWGKVYRRNLIFLLSVWKRWSINKKHTHLRLRRSRGKERGADSTHVTQHTSALKSDKQLRFYFFLSFFFSLVSFSRAVPGRQFLEKQGIAATKCGPGTLFPREEYTLVMARNPGSASANGTAYSLTPFSKMHADLLLSYSRWKVPSMLFSIPLGIPELRLRNWNSKKCTLLTYASNLHLLPLCKIGKAQSLELRFSTQISL